MVCRICGESSESSFIAKEMVLGTRHEFTYFQCSKCSTIQIAEIPKNLADYYPESYYSLNRLEASSPHSGFKAKLLKKRDLQTLRVQSSLIGKLMAKLRPANFDSMYLAYTFVYERLKKPGIQIHDAGCGNGFFLKYFHDLGYTGLSGSDPFLSEDLAYGKYIVEKKDLASITKSFDVILLNHVIEHVTDPVTYLKQISDRLNPNGECLVRTPMSTSDGFETFNEHWVGLEPPRHLHIFDAEYFTKLAEKVGLHCTKIQFDGIGWHFQASEAYSKNISLNELNQNNPFSELEIAHFNKLAKQANTLNKGDTVAYYLKKK